MKINEVLLEAEPGSTTNISALKNNSQVKKMAQLAQTNFGGYLAAEQNRRRSQGNTTAMNDSEFIDLLTNYFNGTMMQGVPLDILNSMPRVARLVSSAIKTASSNRDNSRAQASAFLDLMAASLAARNNPNLTFRTQPQLDIKAGARIPTARGMLTFDGTNWSLDGTELDKDTSRMMLRNIST